MTDEERYQDAYHEAKTAASRADNWSVLTMSRYLRSYVDHSDPEQLGIFDAWGEEEERRTNGMYRWETT